MNYKGLYILLLVNFLVLGLAKADSNQRYIDSLLHIAEEATHDSTKAINYLLVGNHYKYSDLSKAEKYISKSITLYKKLGYKRETAIAILDMGMAKILSNNYKSASDYFLTSKKMGEELDDLEITTRAVTGLASLYEKEGKYEKAIMHYKNAEMAYIHEKDTAGLAIVYNSLGIAHRELNNIEKAKQYYLKSIDLADKIGEKRNKSSAMINLIVVYYSNGQVQDAIETSETLLKELYEMGNYRNAAGLHSNLSRMYDEQDMHEQAIKHIKAALQLSEGKKLVDFLPIMYHTAFVIYNNVGDYKKAIEYLEKELDLKDSLHSVNTSSLESKLEIEEKSKELNKSKAEKELADLMIRTQRNKNMFLVGGLLVSLLVIGLLYFMFRSKMKANRLINRQKLMLEEKNKEITDSINYAKRIQSAILPPDKLIKKHLPHSFVLYKPKDIVAGDFYWMETVKDTVYFAAADCTGHGVPGAMVSVVCNSGLNRAVREHQLRQPGQILDKTRELVIQEFEKSSEEVKDGMDIALCSLNTKTKELQYAGAHNPLWVIKRNGQLEEIKATKQPIGKFDEPIPYPTHTLQLEEGDTVYLFSDGYVDQFGGEKGKKLKSRAFKQLLLDGHQQPMNEQKQKLEFAFEEWKRDLEQIDDVCVIGVKV